MCGGAKTSVTIVKTQFLHAQWLSIKWFSIKWLDRRSRMSPMGEARWGEVRWGEGEQERPVIDAFTCRMQEDTHTTRTK